MVLLDALPQLALKLLLGLELIVSISSLFGVAVAVYIIKTSTKWMLTQRLIGFNYLLSYYLYTTLRIFNCLMTFFNDKPSFKWLDMLQSGALYVGIGNCLILLLDRTLAIRWPNICNKINYITSLIFLSMALWIICYLYHLLLYMFEMTEAKTFDLVREVVTSIVSMVIVILVVVANRVAFKETEKRKEGLRDMNPEEQNIMRKKLESESKIGLLYKPVLIRLLVAVTVCSLLQIGATAVEMFHLPLSSVVSILFSPIFHIVIFISPALMLHATLHDRDNLFLLRRTEGFCETINKVLLRNNDRSTIYELQPNNNTQPITLVRDELFRQETERQSNHFYTLTQYWRHPNPIPPGTILVPENRS